MRFAYLAALGCCLISFISISAEANDTIGSFRFIEKKDGVTDEDRSLIVTYSPGEDTRLSWRCRGPDLEALTDIGQYMVGDNYDVSVRYRVDKSLPSPLQSWALSSENDAAFVPDSEVPEFTRQAISGKTIVIGVTDLFDGAEVQHEFDLSGLGAAIKMLPCFRGFAQ
ncbi:hypothetical protein EN925_00875 [Mesorhizobium sp. M7A.F.Ca.US.006.04.2.1]|uniref:hypothetical protein n=1 Tax=unclassified Mesorhizobium TaxID=325217 RepID=UPI000FCC9B6F|nr:MULTISPECIES: hypothetical protein [unclassified Mesorhizobium]RUX73385.1 hypothetical protein EN990_21635 [Mesorhizobium sp. M7A.F.Ca.US.005.03.1.1]RUY19356.1 hypothetical protein EN991_00585 [Mesorhizobium sp. M7A.F.Ca.US.005.03.2.1]RVA96643.1 hypothetical protein EN925_00875 [Mesorhizobium sp. M7A.F.Ca.US.006.04.2.1]